MTSEQPATEGTSADHSRSGDDIAEAIGVAERGSSVEEVHDRGTEATSGEAPVERSAGDPEMTEGQVAYGNDDAGAGAAHGGPGTSPGADGRRAPGWRSPSSAAARRPGRSAAGDPAG